MVTKNFGLRAGMSLSPRLRTLLGVVLCFLSFWCATAAAGVVQDPYKAAFSTARHSKLKELDGPFASGQEVTRACLHCHTEAASQVMKTTHWTWQYAPKDARRTYGKQHVTNAFCGSVQSNWKLCARCHVGYGWKDPEVVGSSEEQVDCLVCHEQTGNYRKYPYGYAVLMSKGEPILIPDLPAMAHSVARSTRHNCGVCHFHGGASDGAKHGDLDSSLVTPGRNVDVHMAKDGLNFNCSVCHTTQEHQIAGSRYAMKAHDTRGIKRPGHVDNTLSSCESCHGATSHRSQPLLNDHTYRIACQTCHIPLYARGGVKTKTSWDWSQAGRPARDNKLPPEPAEVAATHPATYSRQHGVITWGENLVPQYAWFDGQVDYTLLHDKIDDTSPVPLNRISGRHGDGKSRIWPFKVMKSKMPYDPVNKNMVINHAVVDSVEDKEAFYRSFDWSRSVAAGMKSPGAPPFSGQVGFVDATMYFPLTHMVAPKESALQCRDCHDPNSRLKDLTDFYLLGRDSSPWIRRLGGLLVLLTLVSVVIHGALRILLPGLQRR
ncbi:MAG: tetrathionate reductase family octaheme c-type cytochrome [Magnetococcales bacterium]|nr:tetrathionate reductase family octaheme c-type cytochrome [Magnetococcales bacterium]MBF0322243.1 tetrathionate reductase family octaheme c-type cytochrome [Magnetococcales bacterium]